MRIEDTDRERSTETSENAILEDLQWLGLSWDEGPDVGGDYDPYRQSGRMEIYREYIHRLRESGKVYACYCTPEELEARRKEMLGRGESLRYDGRCRELTSRQQKRFEDGRRKPSFRLRVEDTEVDFDDLVKGHVSFLGENIGDFILVRPDGMPMYNFACVVDDHLMAISHVIRGDDHVSNTPRQILLYRAFGWEPPVFAHIPMILGMDRMRLTKRHGATSISEYREQGYLPETLINFLSLLSWSSESGEEILSVDRLVEEFDFDRVSKSAAIFDVEKFDWMNGVYIRNLDLERLTELSFPFLQKAGFSVSSLSEVRPVAALLQDKIERISQIPEKAKIFYQDEVIAEDAEALKILKKSEYRQVYKVFLEELASVNRVDWNAENFKSVMKRVQESTGIKGRNLWMPMRVALTGQVHGPDLPLIADILGFEKCRRFVEKAFKG